jgi:nitrite reductase/ring-hydroxylating ferredoxin subunit
MTASPVPVCAAADVPENGVISREIGDELVAIYNIDGAFYATEARCTHGFSDLADGTLEGDVIECSFHFGAFHVPSGKAVQAPCFINIKTFRTEVKDGQVYVDLSTPAPTAAT